MRILNLSFGYYPQNINTGTLNYEVLCACVNPNQEAISSGKAIKLPTGKFDILKLLEQLPEGWKPDLISLSSSLLVAKNPPLPLGINRLECPTVMKLSDSHHGHRPIQSIIEYSLQVGCSYHWTIYDRHHLHFYREAGLSNVFWMPGAININFSHHLEPSLNKEHDVIFCGSSDDYHFYRQYLLAFLNKNAIKVTRTRFPEIEMVYDAYSKSKIVFNCSLNGDLNLRVFETLMSGGFLLTDRLSSNSGLTHLFEVGKHFDWYESEQELLEKVQFYLKNPLVALEIATNGQKHFLQNYHPQFLRDTFYNHVIHKTPLPSVFLGQCDQQKIFMIENQDRNQNFLPLKSRLEIYEFLQYIQQFSLSSELVYFLPRNKSLVNDIQNLEKLKIIIIESAEELKEYKAKSCSIVIIDGDYLIARNIINFIDKFNIVLLVNKISFFEKIFLYLRMFSKSFYMKHNLLFNTMPYLAFCKKGFDVSLDKVKENSFLINYLLKIKRNISKLRRRQL
jgi:hypothetical protein